MRLRLIGPVLLAVITGVMIGAGLFTFGYARGASYLTNDPQACGNCHVMRDQLNGWRKSSHGKVAVCNDCHTPPGLLPKYATKALNGYLHSWAFTTGRFPDEIRIHSRNYNVTQSACLKCHEEVVTSIRGVRGHRAGVDCIACHRTVGHM